jgi:hypothetical protein
VRVAVTILALATAAGVAAAQPANDTFAQAEAKFAAKDKAAACPLYEQALAAESELPWKSAFLASTKLALCKRESGKVASAIALYRHAAAILHAQTQSHDNDQRAAQAEKVAGELAGSVSRVTVAVSAELAKLDGLIVELDGRAISRDHWNQPIEVDGGSHAVHAAAPGHTAFDRKLDVTAEHESKEVRIELAPVAEHPAPPPVVVRAPPPPPAPVLAMRRSHVPAFVAAGAGVLALGVAAGFEVSARSTYTKYTADPSHPDSLLSSANSKRHVANALGVAGGVGLAAAAALWFLWPEHAEATQVTIVPAARSVSASLEWRF